MGKFSMSHSGNPPIEQIEAAPMPQIIQLPAQPTPKCELLHCNGHEEVDLAPFIKKDDMPDYKPLFKEYDFKMLYLNDKYDILIADHRNASLAMEKFSDKIDSLSSKTEGIESKINENSTMVDSEIDKMYNNVNSKFDSIRKDLELMNNKLEKEETKLEKYMPLIQVMVAVLLSVIIIKSF